MIAIVVFGGSSPRQPVSAAEATWTFNYHRPFQELEMPPVLLLPRPLAAAVAADHQVHQHQVLVAVVAAAAAAVVRHSARLTVLIRCPFAAATAAGTA